MECSFLEVFLLFIVYGFYGPGGVLEKKIKSNYWLSWI